jgi:hypothetical protein
MKPQWALRPCLGRDETEGPPRASTTGDPAGYLALGTGSLLGKCLAALAGTKV